MNLDPASTRTGFHWPPFNTVHHLHLHVISPIEKMSGIRKLMFPNPNNYWFVSVSIKIIRLILNMKDKFLLYVFSFCRQTM